MLRHTVKDVKPDDRAAKGDERMWFKLEQLSEKLAPEYPNEEDYHTAIDLVKPASHKGSESSSLTQGAEDEDEEEAKDWDNLR